MPRFDYRAAEKSPDSPPGLIAQRAEIPYVLPFFTFLLVMVPGGVGQLGGLNFEALWKTYLPALYTLKTLLAALLLWYFWPCYTRVQWHKWWLGIIVGIFGTFLWLGTGIACQKLHIAQVPPDSAIYNPDKMLGGGWREILFLCIRVAGPSLVVPFMEELFFRDFVTRLLIRRDDFQQVPIGTFTWPSLLIMSAAFGLNHGFNLFIPGFLYGLLMGILLIRTKSLGACIIAHGTTNLTLYLYVIYFGDWQWM